ncbi:tyrosine-type recombinase/integrase [Cellulomonas triticagri]|nr:tyrosine-type recombinase/integrase [Cellulomonas triticagri]
MAWNRAQELDAEQSGRVDPKSRTLGDLVAEYVSTPLGRKCDKHGRPLGTSWTDTHHTTVTQDLTRAVGEVATLPAHALDRAVVDRMRTACGTPGMVGQMTRHVRGFLNWACRQGALTDTQAALLPSQHAPLLEPRFPQPEARPSRHRTAPLVGQAEDYVGPEDCPQHEAVRAFADELQLRMRWGALAVHFAAATGLRVGEQFQLRADDIVEREGHLVVRVDWQWSAGRTRRARPKTGKRRRVPVPPINRSGIGLEQMLLDRVRAARAEQAAGTNPEALLFPAPEGGMWWSSNLNELLIRAQKAAGWRFEMVTERRKLRNGATRDIRVTQMQHPWHSLRHRFARDMIDWLRLTPAQLMAIGGWASLEVLSSRYYRSGSEHWGAATNAVHGADGPAAQAPWEMVAVAVHDTGAVPSRHAGVRSTGRRTDGPRTPAHSVRVAGRRHAPHS